MPNAHFEPDKLPEGSQVNEFVAQDRRTGTRSMLTMPLVGWTPKARAQNCGFSVAKYGPQQSVDPYFEDCGNGIRPNGELITTNDPADISMAIDETFVKEWIAYLTGKYGTAAQGGVAFYSLDNEPMLWNHTHRDVHPAPVSYDELRDLTYQYAPAIKEADPSAAVFGPALWGWTAYFYSAKDITAEGEWWNNPPDRNAHGGLPFVAWYLDQMRQYEEQHGVRILDYLDLHYYPAASGVTLSGAGSAETQQLRLRTTRSLWDPTYLDESWINDTVQLIPRMKEWVNRYYPGTKLALTEYNWGALDHINGALAQADVLGIFGREGLDFATLWAPPRPNDPGALAFRMYRNYDGAGSRFGDIGVHALSSDQAQLAIYAAQRSSDGALTIMLINKSDQSFTSDVNIGGNFDLAPNAQMYVYGAGMRGIKQQADLSFTNGQVTPIMHANSLTLLVIPAATAGTLPTPLPTATPILPTVTPVPASTPVPTAPPVPGQESNSIKLPIIIR
ncbi:MAG: glycoside hydrolase family 44 protein [Caldilineaceae bacterium]